MNQIHIPDLKKNIKNSGLVKGVWMMTVNPAFAEIACLLEIDFVVIDLEHGAITLTDLPHILRGFRGNTAALVRVPSSDPTLIARVLDRGAHGVMVPRVETIEEARTVSDAAKYPPSGSRGIALPALRASGYGLNPNYRTSADRDAIVIIQIESSQALRAAPEIAELPNVDALFLGPSDLSANLNLEGTQNLSTFERTVDSFFDICKTKKILSGTIVFGNYSEETLKSMGCNILVMGSDVSIMRSGLQAFK